MRLWWWVLPVLAVGVFGWSIRDIPHPPGVTAPDDPVQTDIPEADRPHFEKPGYSITGLARFSLHARVLGIDRYRYDREADLVPRDFAFGWGPMSDSRVLAHLDLSQHGRFYFYSWSDDPPLEPAQIISHSANMHLIPANEEVARTLGQARRGHILDLSGYLVRVDGPDGFYWISSLSRFDTDGGACELVWVEEVSLAE